MQIIESYAFEYLRLKFPESTWIGTRNNAVFIFFQCQQWWSNFIAVNTPRIFFFYILSCSFTRNTRLFSRFITPGLYFHHQALQDSLFSHTTPLLPLSINSLHTSIPLLYLLSWSFTCFQHLYMPSSALLCFSFSNFLNVKN